MSGGGVPGDRRARSGRWVKIDNSEADLEQVIGTVLNAIGRARERQPLATSAVGGGAASPAPANDVAAIGDPAGALAALFEWVDRRAAHEPLLAAYVLGGMAGEGVDERRFALAARAPRVIARGLRGLSDAVSWQLRRMLLEGAPQEVAQSLVDQAAEAPPPGSCASCSSEAPYEVAISLTGLDDETAWALREELAERVPDAVMMSLALLDGTRAWGLRERWIAQRGGLEAAMAGYFGARAAARSVTGVGGSRAWAIRKAARGPAPVPALASLQGLGDDKSWQLARTRPPPRAQAGPGDDPGLDDGARLGHALGHGAALPGGARLDDRTRRARGLGDPREPASSVALERDQEPRRAGERRARRGDDARGRWRARPVEISLLKQATAVAIGAQPPAHRAGGLTMPLSAATLGLGLTSDLGRYRGRCLIRLWRRGCWARSWATGCGGGCCPTPSPRRARSRRRRR